MGFRILSVLTLHLLVYRYTHRYIVGISVHIGISYTHRHLLRPLTQRRLLNPNLNSQPSKRPLDPNSRSLNPKPYIVNPVLQTLHPKPYAASRAFNTDPPFYRTHTTSSFILHLMFEPYGGLRRQVFLALESCIVGQPPHTHLDPGLAVGIKGLGP